MSGTKLTCQGTWLLVVAPNPHTEDWCYYHFNVLTFSVATTIQFNFTICAHY